MAPLLGGNQYDTHCVVLGSVDTLKSLYQASSMKRSADDRGLTRTSSLEFSARLQEERLEALEILAHYAVLLHQQRIVGSLGTAGGSLLRRLRSIWAMSGRSGCALANAGLGVVGLFIR